MNTVYQNFYVSPLTIIYPSHMASTFLWQPTAFIKEPSPTVNPVNLTPDEALQSLLYPILPKTLNMLNQEGKKSKKDKAILLRKENKFTILSTSSANEYTFFCVEIESEAQEAFHNAESINLIPNFTISDESNRTHFIYILEEQITKSTLKTKLDKHFEATILHLQLFLNANYCHLPEKLLNPWHSNHTVVYHHSQRFYISDIKTVLDKNCPEVYKKYAKITKKPLASVSSSERTNQLFNHLREYSYFLKINQDFEKQTDFDDAIQTQAIALNSYFKHPLPEKKVNNIAKQVSSWTWKNYTGNGKYSKNRGILNLCDKLPAKDRQSMGGRYSGPARKKNTLICIKLAYDEFVNKFAKEPKPAEIVRLTGKDQKTVTKKWHLLEKSLVDLITDNELSELEIMPLVFDEIPDKVERKNTKYENFKEKYKIYLQSQGANPHNISAISRFTGIHRNTVAKYLAQINS